jgi:hypothetical protein
MYMLESIIKTGHDQIKEDEMGRACSTNGRDEECIQDIGGNARRKETTRKTKK